MPEGDTIWRAARALNAALVGRTVWTSSPLAPFRLWVYRRSGQPCRRCGTGVRRREQGAPARSTYWCPACQALPTGADVQAAGRPSHQP